jgi:hypothetical protein
MVCMDWGWREAGREGGRKEGKEGKRKGSELYLGMGGAETDEGFQRPGSDGHGPAFLLAPQCGIIIGDRLLGF